MRRVWDSLSGQLLALLLAALVAAHVFAVAVMSWGARTDVHPLAVRTIITQVLVAYRLAQADKSHATLQALAVPEAHFARTLRLPAHVRAAQHQNATLLAAVRAGLDLPASATVYAALHAVDLAPADVAADAPAWLRDRLAHGTAWSLDIAVPLPDGQWLVSQHWPTMMHPHWDRVLQFSLLVSVLACILVALLFGRSVMRPLQALARAAQRISRGESTQPLPLQGPRGVRGITRAFNDMQERLGRFVADRTQMLAAIGHDLRTPLASLRIRTELIQDRQMRDAIRRTLDDMTTMVEETLRFARDDATHAATASVDLAALITEVVEEQRVAGKTVAWTPPAQALIYRCRPVHLKRAVRNLIENAMRYGRVAVYLHASATHVRILVQDDGPGIAPAMLERVFEPFARGDTARNLEGGHAGLGLGLAIARSFVRAHGGDIQLRNRAEGGLCAQIDLPK